MYRHGSGLDAPTSYHRQLYRARPDILSPAAVLPALPQRHHRALSVASRIISIIFLRMGMINQDLWSVRLVLPDCQIHRQNVSAFIGLRSIDAVGWIVKMLDQIIIIFQLFPQTRAVHQCGRILPSLSFLHSFQHYTASLRPSLRRPVSHFHEQARSIFQVEVPSTSLLPENCARKSVYSCRTSCSSRYL